MKQKVAFQGEHGAYSELAAFNHFGENIETVPCRTFKEMFEKIEEKECRECGKFLAACKPSIMMRDE